MGNRNNPTVTQKVKPFARQSEFTMFHNFTLDILMPMLSPNAWKCLCLIIRKTIGWVDDNGDRKTKDEISFSQFVELTGIGSRTTVSRALSDLEDRRLIIVHRSDNTLDTNIYELNLEFEGEMQVSLLKLVKSCCILEMEHRLSGEEEKLWLKIEELVKTRPDYTAYVCHMVEHEDRVHLASRNMKAVLHTILHEKNYEAFRTHQATLL